MGPAGPGSERCAAENQLSRLLRYRVRASIGIDGDVRKYSFRHLDRFITDPALDPALDLDGYRGVADPVYVAVAGDFIADHNGTTKCHAGNGYRDDAAARAACG